MILVTVGTNEQPFDRLVRAAARLGGEEALLVQHGSSLVPRGRGEWVDYMPFDELAARASEARVVVCHAGVGSIMMARRCGRRPVVVPRRHQLGEAVDDHQVALARRLAESGLVRLVEDETELEAVLYADAVAIADPVASSLEGAAQLTNEVRELLAGFGAAPFSGRAA
jgi:UDP-N-acetylglucosamine transferase subunit ALG13